MPEHKQKRRNSLPAQRTQSAREAVPESSSVLAQLPNSARLSVAEPESGDLDALAEKFAQHKLPSEELNDSILSAPRGGDVSELDENGFRQLQQDLNGQVVDQTAFKKGERNVFSKWGRSVARSHRRAYDDIMAHKQDKSYYKLSKVNRFLYFMKNPLAVMRSWGGKKHKEEWAQEYNAKKQNEEELIRQYREKYDVGTLSHDNYKWGGEDGALPQNAPAQNAPALNGQAPADGITGNATYGPNLQLEDTLRQYIPIAENTLKNMEGVKDIPFVKELVADRQIGPEGIMEKASIGTVSGLAGNAISSLKGVGRIAKGISDLSKSTKTGLTAKKASAGLSLGSAIAGTGNFLSKTMSSIGKLFGKVLPGSLAEKFQLGDKSLFKVAGLDVTGTKGLAVVNNGLKMAKGITNISSAGIAKSRLSKVRENLTGLSDNDRNSMRKLIGQAKSAASKRQIEGSKDVLTSVLGIGSNFIPGVGSTIASGANLFADAVMGMQINRQQKKINNRVLSEDMPELDDKIEQYAKYLAAQEGRKPGELNLSERDKLLRRAKHIILKAHGFSSGKRSEAASFFSTARAKYLAGRANHQEDGNQGNKTALDVVKAMGVGKRKKGGYNEDDIAERLGRAKKQDDVIASRRSNIEALAQKKNKGFWNNTKRLLGWMFS